MTRSITLVTKNPLKIEAMERALVPYKIALNVENFYVPEIQSDTCEEVAKFSAQYAANYSGKAVVKADTGFYIDSLGGLPGVYTSEFERKLSPQKLLKLMQDETTRSASVVYAVAFCLPQGEPVVFSSGSRGIIAEDVQGQDGMLIDSIFIPEGFTRTLGEIKLESQAQADAVWGDAEEQFIKWYIQTQPI